MNKGVAVLGVFVADTTYHAAGLPILGQTVKGTGFAIGPGGKGSNQAVASAMAGAKTSFITKVGRDSFADLALETYQRAGVSPIVEQMDNVPTGAAFIYLNDKTGDNAIIVYPGAAGTLTPSDVERARATIESAAVFVTQLEQSDEAAETGLRIARAAGTKTIFNPAPAEPFPQGLYELCDFIVPNESEAAALVGFELVSLLDARRAGDVLLNRGVGCALITLGARGVLIHSRHESIVQKAMPSGPVVDTTGAGDAFLGGFAALLSRGTGLRDAVRFGCATAGIAITPRGAATAMPRQGEIEQALAQAMALD